MNVYMEHDHTHEYFARETGDRTSTGILVYLQSISAKSMTEQMLALACSLANEYVHFGTAFVARFSAHWPPGNPYGRNTPLTIDLRISLFSRVVSDER